MRVAIVIPCRGEGNVSELVGRAGLHGDVFIADDNAIDGTFVTRHSVPEVTGIVRVPADRHGFSEVYRLGIVHAVGLGYDYIIEMDAGGSHDPAEIPTIVRALQHGGVDLATGERFKYGRFHGHWKRRWLSRGGTWLFNRVHGTAFADATGGFIGYTRAAAAITHGYRFTAAGHWYQSEVRLRALAAGLSIREIPIAYRSSSSSLNLNSIVEALRLLRRQAP